MVPRVPQTHVDRRSLQPRTSIQTVIPTPSSDSTKQNQETLHFTTGALIPRAGEMVNQDYETYKFIGPNGAGKSTTFNCITGTHPPTSGTVWYDGDDVTGLGPHEMVKRGLARTFQSFRPLKDRSVIANVALSLAPDSVFSLSGLRGETKAKAARICELVELGSDLEKMPDELPHAGMLRLELARALATNPDILLLDEPFAGLADREVTQLSELIEQLRAENDITMVIVDHNMRGLLSLVDRVIVIRFGQLIAKGTPDEIRTNRDVRQAYLGGDAL